MASAQTSGSRANKRKGHSEILTSTPEKVHLEERGVKRDKKFEELRKKTAALKRINEEAKNRNESVKMSKKSEKKGEESKSENEKSTGEKNKLKKSTSKPSRKQLPRLTTRKQKATAGLQLKSSQDGNMNRWSCITCNEIFVHPPKEDWIQCSTCEEWCHERCAGKKRRVQYLQVF